MNEQAPCDLQPVNESLAGADPQVSRSSRRLTSQELFNDCKTLEIEHARQIYLLRITRENKLILTK